MRNSTDIATDLFFVVLFSLGVMAIVFWSLSCHDGCDPKETRCNGSRAEVCDADEDWRLIANCSDVEPADLDWVCCWVDEELVHACVPVVACEEEVE